MLSPTVLKGIAAARRLLTLGSAVLLLELGGCCLPSGPHTQPRKPLSPYFPFLTLNLILCHLSDLAGAGFVCFVCLQPDRFGFGALPRLVGSSLLSP